MFIKNVFVSLLFILSIFNLDLSAFEKETLRNLDRSTVALLDSDHDLCGTAFAISKNGYFVTNWHVVEGGGERFYAKFWNNQVVPCDLVFYNKSNDLAVVKLRENREITHFIQVKPETSLARGERIATCGFPEYGGKPIRYGTVRGFNGTFHSLTPGLKYIEARLKLTPGMSGSPVINNHGQLVGIHNHKDRNQSSFSIPVKHLVALLEKKNLSYVDGDMLAKREEDSGEVAVPAAA